MGASVDRASKSTETAASPSASRAAACPPPTSVTRTSPRRPQRSDVSANTRKGGAVSTTATDKMAAPTTPRRTARAEHVGSLLRPAKLKRLVEQIYEPGHSALLAEERAKDLTELHAAEDEAIRDAVRRQLDIGLDVVSDGEFRRFMFTGSFYDAVDGLTAGTGQVPFTNEEGELEYYTGLPVVDGELHRIDAPAAREAAFVKILTDHPFKVTFPAASIFWFPLAYVPGVTDKV